MLLLRLFRDAAAAAEDVWPTGTRRSLALGDSLAQGLRRHRAGNSGALGQGRRWRGHVRALRATPSTCHPWGPCRARPVPGQQAPRSGAGLRPCRGRARGRGREGRGCLGAGRRGGTGPERAEGQDRDARRRPGPRTAPQWGISGFLTNVLPGAPQQVPRHQNNGTLSDGKWVSDRA